MSDGPGAVIVSGGGVVVRYATAADVPAVVAQAGRYTANVVSGTISQSAFELEPFVTAQVTGENPDSRLLVAVLASVIVGVLSVAAETHPATGVRLATDLFWWTEIPETIRAQTGVRLMDAFEDWAADRDGVRAGGHGARRGRRVHAGGRVGAGAEEHVNGHDQGTVGDRAADDGRARQSGPSLEPGRL
jgi:hypothetical protein